MMSAFCSLVRRLNICLGPRCLSPIHGTVPKPCLSYPYCYFNLVCPREQFTDATYPLQTCAKVVAISLGSDNANNVT